MMREDKNSVKRSANIILTIGALVIVFIITACICAINADIKDVNKKQAVSMTTEQKILEETPLNNYLLFDASEEYKKFQIEAAEMVDSLITEGKTTEEACEEALMWLSEAIYDDKEEFRDEYPNVIEDYEAYQKDYLDYLEKTQG